MASLVDTEQSRCDADRLQGFIRDLFTGAGVPGANAARLAEIIVCADLRGAYSHGCALVPGYIMRMLKGEVDPKGEPKVERDAGAVLLIDAANGQGHLAVAFAMESAVERAREMGAAVAAIGRSNHCGAMGYYPVLALAHDMIGIAMTNSVPSMAWFGGIDRILGINPIGIAIPAGEETPIVIDTSFGAVARGKIAIHAQLGRPLPEGWATDADGNATIDPGRALEGLILPAGGYKGTSIALVVGILSALLSGAAYGTELGDLTKGATAGADGQFVLVLNVAAFEDVRRFKARIDGIVRQIHASQPAPGVSRILVPGERAAESERLYRSEGIPLTAATRQALADIAARVGVDPTVVRP
ncbi:MAG: Ldh family oxidoreductase [Rhizobiaceae bacterium]